MHVARFGNFVNPQYPMFLKDIQNPSKSKTHVILDFEIKIQNPRVILDFEHTILKGGPRMILRRRAPHVKKTLYSWKTISNHQTIVIVDVYPTMFSKKNINNQ